MNKGIQRTGYRQTRFAGLCTKTGAGKINVETWKLFSSVSQLLRADWVLAQTLGIKMFLYPVKLPHTLNRRQTPQQLFFAICYLWKCRSALNWVSSICPTLPRVENGQTINVIKFKSSCDHN